jgi:hypothetical protein
VAFMSAKTAQMAQSLSRTLCIHTRCRALVFADSLAVPRRHTDGRSQPNVAVVSTITATNQGSRQQGRQTLRPFAFAEARALGLSR